MSTCNDNQLQLSIHDVIELDIPAHVKTSMLTVVLSPSVEGVKTAFDQAKRFISREDFVKFSVAKNLAIDAVAL